MKKTLLIACGMLALSQTQAQQSHFSYSTKRENGNSAVIKSILRHQAGPAALKPTGTQQRVIAQGTTSYDGLDTYLDSLRFSYSGTNGSRYDFNNIGYNEEFDPLYAPIFVDFRYDSDPLNMLADSIYTYSEEELSEISRAFYRADKKIDSVYTYGIYEGTPETFRKANTRYSTNGALLQKVYLERMGATYDTVTYTHYTYNNDYTRLLADTNAFDPSSGFYFGNRRYVYNGAGQLDSVIRGSVTMGVPAYNRSFFEYYSDGKLRKATQQYLNGSTWMTESVDSVGYNTSGNYVTYWLQTSYNAGVPDPSLQWLQRQFPGANGLPDSAFQYSWSTDEAAWVPEMRWNYTYNEYNNPTKFVATALSNTPEEMEGFINFYYELFDDAPSSIKPLADNKDFSVYPNPFNDKITIDWKGKTQSGVTVRMVNIIGQEVYRSSLKLQAGTNALTIPAINSGNYILLLQDAQGKSWSSKVVKR